MHLKSKTSLGHLKRNNCICKEHGACLNHQPVLCVLSVEKNQSGPGLSLLLKVRPNVLHGLLTRLPAVLASDSLDHLDNLQYDLTC